MDYMYNWPLISIDLNTLSEDLILKICPTDCRLRSDQKALEFRNIDLATKEKQRLEVNQRTRRKHRQTNNIEHQPVWFEKYFDEDSQEEVWGYKGGYWETRFFYYHNNCKILNKPLPKKGNPTHKNINF